MRTVLLTLFMAGSFLIASCEKGISVGVKIDTQLSSYVPPASTLLAGVDVDSLRATPFYQRHENELNVPALGQMAEQVGVDPRRDLSRVLIAWSGQSPIMLARGRFTADKIEPHLLSLGSKRSEYHNQALFGTSGQAVFFPAGDIAIGGPQGDIRAIIDRRKGGIPQALADRMRQLPKSDQAWIVSQGFPLARIPMRSDVESALSNIVDYVSGINAGIGFDEGAHLQADVLCISADDAKQVHDALRGGIGFARLTTKDDQLGLLKLYDAIQVTYDQQTVHVRADLSPQLADQLMGLMSGLEKGRGGTLLPR